MKALSLRHTGLPGKGRILLCKRAPALLKQLGRTSLETWVDIKSCIAHLFPGKGFTEREGGRRRDITVDETIFNLKKVLRFKTHGTGRALFTAASLQSSPNGRLTAWQLVATALENRQSPQDGASGNEVVFLSLELPPLA